MTAQKPATKTEIAYRLLKTQILECRLAPGAPLRLDELRAQFDLGWTPLREALTRLEGDRLVVSRSNRGFAVSDVSLAHLEDICQTRLLLELSLLEEAIENGDGAWEEEVSLANFRLNRCTLLTDEERPNINPSHGNFSEWEDRHQQFHLALLAASTSQWKKRYYLDVMMHLNRHLRYLIGHPDYLRLVNFNDDPASPAGLLRARVIDSHTDLMAAAIDRDRTRARELMTEHALYPSQAFSEFEAAAGTR